MLHMAFHTTVLIQHTQFAKSLKYVGPVFHFDETVKPVLGEDPMVHSQVSGMTG